MGRGAKAKKGDYAAVATVGIDAAGYFYLLDIWLKRAAPTAQISAVFDLHEKWNYTLFGLETNCFQQLLLMPFEEERLRRRQSGRSWQLPIREVNHSANKEMRIGTLEPLITNAWLRFSNTLPEQFWAQIEAFPRAEHDDALDALEGAIALLRGLQTETKRGAPRKSTRKMKHY